MPRLKCVYLVGIFDVMTCSCMCIYGNDNSTALVMSVQKRASCKNPKQFLLAAGKLFLEVAILVGYAKLACSCLGSLDIFSGNYHLLVLCQCAFYQVINTLLLGNSADNRQI